MGAEQEDVACHRLDGPVLVDGADERVVRLGQHPVVARLRDGAPRRDRGQPGALPGPQLAVDPVVVQVGAPPAPPGLDAVGHQVHDLVELLPLEAGVVGGPAHEVEQLVGAPLLGGDLGHDLLGGDVEGQAGELHRVESAGPHGGQQGRALDELVAGEGEEAALRRPRPAVVGAAHPLEEGGDAAGRADLAHQLDGADVDAQLERSGGHEGPEVAGPQPGLDPVAALLGEAAVVGRHRLVAEALGQLVGQALGQPAGVDEDERGAVLGHERGDPVEDVGQLLVGGDGLQLGVGQLEGQIDRALVAHVDDLRQGPVAHQQAAHRLHRALGGREADAGRPPVAQGLEPLQAEGQVGPPLVAGDGVDLVDDDGVDGAQRLASPPAGDEEVERLRRRHHEARRVPEHGRPLGAGGVAGADADREVRRRQAELDGHGGDLVEGSLEVLGDVDGQRLEGRHVEHPGHVGDLGPVLGRPVEPVDGDQEGGQGLARPRRGGDERVLRGGDGGPAPPLGLRGALREAAPEPGAHRRVEALEGAGRARLGPGVGGHDQHPGDPTQGV
jgi:hypothetical protein